MGRKKKSGIKTFRSRELRLKQARAALYLMENDLNLTRQDVASKFGVSKTTLRRDLRELIQSNPGDLQLKARIAQINSRPGRPPTIDAEKVKNARRILDLDPSIRTQDIAKQLGVGHSTLQRMFRKLRDVEQENENIDSDSRKMYHRKASQLIGPAFVAINSLAIPNDLEESERDLFLELRKSIEDLHQKINTLTEKNESLISENKSLQEQIQNNVPLWEEAWETFVLNFAQQSGTSVAKASLFSAGFIAGSLYSAFSS